MRHIKHLLITLLITAVCQQLYAQNIALLNAQLAHAKSDTAKANYLIQFANYYGAKNNLDSALWYNKSAFYYAKRSKNKPLIAKINMGLSYSYYKQNKYAESLASAYTALHSYEQLQDPLNIINSYVQIADILQIKKSYNKAEELLNNGLVLSKMIKNDDLRYNVLSRLADIFADKKENEKAITAYEQVINYYTNIHDSISLRQAYNNLAVVYYRLNNYPKNKEFLLKAYDITIKTNNKESSATALINLGIVETKLKNYASALHYLNQAYVIANKKNDKEALMYVYGALDDIYKAHGNYKKAHEAINNYLEIYEALNSEQTNEAFNAIKTKQEVALKERELNATQQQKETAFKIEQAKQATKLRFQRWITALSIFGLLSLIGVVVLVVRNLKRNKTASAIIAQQKQEIELKHKETTDSINYAKRIQDGLLTTEETINANFENCFMLFKPKDIVSGDFYWGTTYKDSFYFVVGDSTGHGVPGAFMALLNTSLLSEVIKERHITEPKLIFNEVRMRLAQIIVGESNKDGFDGVLIKKQGNNIAYVAANNELVLIRNGELLKQPNDRMPVGKFEKMDSFSTHTIQLQNNDCVYLFTDGYPDQFGGSNNKKFMSKKLKELLRANAHLPMQEQKQLLEVMFNQWIGNYEQTDDVTVFGFKHTTA